jgi:hypothetical protein
VWQSRLPTARTRSGWLRCAAGSRRLDGAEAWAVIDRISDKYGAPYPRTEERVIFIVDATHLVEETFG